ncbi:unnamed protein product [Urochloa decumbens]|uniref:Disease resistance protein At4g27190-like leucine-rich repeats domain-containing protein n=1 Tax=Urochloa decumbens TaxID=240449 RepID=A0ABC9C134_9POAL
MNRLDSLRVRNNSIITTVIPESMMSIGKENEKRTVYWSSLKRCHIEGCSKLETVFSTNYDNNCFDELKTLSAADLLKARCIWSKGRVAGNVDGKSFAKFQAIRLHFCPRLIFVLPLSWNYTLSSLETLHIVYCGHLNQVFPGEAVLLSKISTGHPGFVLEFPKLKHIHLHELPKLHQICEAKMFAPELMTIWVRGCWSLKRIPASGVRQGSRPVVDCEKDWWEKLEWDGKEAHHHPSLFEPRHSKYYKKKNLLRRTVLR